jgi:hypothetical protein
MPRCWFNVRDRDDLFLGDAEGCQLPDLNAVKNDAARPPVKSCVRLP